MIKHLKYKVTFPTGRTLEFNQEFPAGSIAITGPNEAGKSLVIEMIRFGLFGTSALRGPVTDYKTLKMEMRFLVRGADYKVERTSSTARLLNGDTVVCTGTSPVNRKLLEIFNYDLAVFDTANVAGQGDVEKLGAMKPTERKQMVDQLIGADRIDELMQWAGQEGLLLKREIDVLERGLVEPVAPEKPADYEDASVLNAAVREGMAHRSALDQLRGWLNREVYPPKAPVWVEGDPDRVAEAIQLLKLPVIDYDPQEVADQWAEFDRWMERERFLNAHPRPSLTLDECQKLTEDAARQQRIAELRSQVARMKTSPTLTCPCGKEFTLQDDAIAAAETELQKLGDPGKEIDMRFVRAQLDALRDWDSATTLAGWDRLSTATAVDEPRYPRTAPARALSPAQRQNLVAEFGSDIPALSGLLERLRAYDRARAVYDSQQAAYETYVEEREEKLIEHARLAALVEGLDDLVDRQLRCAEFDRSQAAYETQKAAYDAQLVVIHNKRELRDGWLASKETFAEVRTRIKTHLVPSLNRVASHLLTQMTGGARSTIVVDENFDVTVDGQRLNTLSGSGKACANLALRIGLGQVLTNNVFSVFIGDEIDASMDQERSTYTQTSLRSLSAKISQVFIITHKAPVADLVVRLGN